MNPRPVTNPQPGAPPRTAACWEGAEVAKRPDAWTRTWTAEQLDDLRVLARSFDVDSLVERLDDGSIGQAASAPLCDLAAGIRSDLIDGLGFTLLRGLNADEFDRDDLAAGLIAFGSLIGSPRSQNADGHLLGHVRDVGLDVADPSTRIYQTNERQTFHTDSTDAVGLLCLRPAKQGGESLLVSVEAVYARMVERDPALAARLFEPLATDRRNEQPPGELPWFEIPVLSWFDGQLSVIYQRQYIESARRFADAPHPDAEYSRALDLFDHLLNDPDLVLRMSFEPGDIQFVHNHSLLHDRGSFLDHDDPELRRHLLRLWLSLDGDRELPEVFAQRYGTVTVGDRGGIVVEGTARRIPVDA